jgi:hypothetical protein
MEFLKKKGKKSELSCIKGLIAETMGSKIEITEEKSNGKIFFDWSRSKFYYCVI